MIDEKFSAKAFLQKGLDTSASKELASLLAEEIQRELHKAIEPAFKAIIERLNSMGHNLKPYVEASPGEISFRDDGDTSKGYQCKLRVAADTVISTGYAHFISGEEERS